MKFWSLALSLVLALVAVDAEAKRLGGGKSTGRQSSNVTQREAAPSTPPTAPAQNAAPAAPAKPAPAAPAAAPRKPWAGMLAGLAAGLGLAWLASSLGLGEAFGQILLFGLLAMVVMAVIGMVMRRRASASQGLAYQAAAQTGNSQYDPATPRSYLPQNVGNDASARPWERSGPVALDNRNVHSGGGSLIGSALGGSQSWGVPAGFDVDGFLSASKKNFVNLQDAWDRSDIPSLRAMMTDGMLEQIRSQLAEREQASVGAQNKTEVVMLDAQLLGIEEMDEEYMASVEFSGLIREEASAGPNPFREVWNITRPKSGNGGWLVAGVQALQ